MKIHAEDPHTLVVIGIDSDVREIHGTRVGVGHFGPRFALVVAAIDAGLLGFDKRVDDVAVAAIDVETDAAEVLLRQAFGHLLPGRAAVEGPINRAAGTSAVHAEDGAAALVGGGKDRVWILIIHRDVVHAGVGIDIEDLVPGLAAVGGFEDAALFVGSPETACGSDIHDVRIGGMDEDPADVVGFLESHVNPGLAAVLRLVHTVAPRGTLAVVRLARPDPDGVGFRGSDGYVTDARLGLLVEDRSPRDAAIDGLPDAGRCGGRVDDVGVGLDDGEVVDAASHIGGSDLSETERLEVRHALRCKRNRKENGEKRNPGHPNVVTDPACYYRD